MSSVSYGVIIDVPDVGAVVVVGATGATGEIGADGVVQARTCD